MANTLRYPGVRPFETSERHLFFGRARDTADLYDLILLEKLLVLFGKSGYGKSSLIKAGIIPLFTEHAADRQSEYLPMEIRFGSYAEGKPTPVETTLAVLEKNTSLTPESDFLAPFFPGKISLWHEFKRHMPPPSNNDLPGKQANHTPRFLLIFDQFEELFTYPAEQQREFRYQIAEALYEAIPQNVRDAIDGFGPAQRDFTARPFDLKALFSIRADRLSLLDGMKDALPGILHKRYELKAMEPKQARSAIVQPAALPQFEPALPGEEPYSFSTPPFNYAPDALQQILDKLSAGNTGGGIEAFQLQIVCQHLERQVQKGLIADRDSDDAPDITVADLPDFDTVYEDYYNDKLSELTPAEARAARTVIEDGLLFVNEATGEARRLSKDPGELMQAYASTGVTQALLDRLTATYLLRREANTVGGVNYEISHDTLIAPIVKAREARRQAEEKRRAARRRLRVLAMLLAAALVTSGAVALALWAIAQKNEALTQKKIADDARTKSDSLLVVATTAQHETKVALVQAKESEDSAVVARNLAVQNLQKFEAASIRIVNDLAAQAETRIAVLDQDSAASLIRKAASLNIPTAPFLNTLTDLAFYYNQAGLNSRADELLRAAGQKGYPAGNRTAMRQWLQNTWPVAAASAMKRYYPNVVAIPGGTFQMGCDATRDGECLENQNLHSATVAAFKLAQAETTYWQYGLFCRATNQNIQDFKEKTFGLAGQYPGVLINWLDAVAYCNWASQSLGLQPVYTTNAKGQVTAVSMAASGFRLPTETEWEYAARAGQKSRFSGSNILAEVGWYDGNSRERIQPVKSKKPNSYGLYDMNGNVSEWCWDWYKASYPAQTAAGWTGPSEEGTDRVLRGGSWNDADTDCRNMFRYRAAPNARYPYYGFRVARGNK